MDIIDLYKGPFLRSQIKWLFLNLRRTISTTKGHMQQLEFIFSQRMCPDCDPALWYTIASSSQHAHVGTSCCALITSLHALLDHWCRLLCCSVSSDLPHSIVKSHHCIIRFKTTTMGFKYCSYKHHAVFIVMNCVKWAQFMFCPLGALQNLLVQCEHPILVQLLLLHGSCTKA